MNLRCATNSQRRLLLNTHKSIHLSQTFSYTIIDNASLLAHNLT